MFIPTNTVPEKKSFTPTSDVYLESGHVCIQHKVAEKIFGSETAVFSIFYPADKTFLVAPVSEELFKNIHKAAQQMLKSKNAAGDRSVSIQELLLDNDLTDSDRDLDFVAEEALHILKVHL